MMLDGRGRPDVLVVVGWRRQLAPPRASPRLTNARACRLVGRSRLLLPAFGCSGAHAASDGGGCGGGPLAAPTTSRLALWAPKPYPPTPPTVILPRIHPLHTPAHTVHSLTRYTDSIPQRRSGANSHAQVLCMPAAAR